VTGCGAARTNIETGKAMTVGWVRFSIAGSERRYAMTARASSSLTCLP
jgi:hypothetical protein